MPEGGEFTSKYSVVVYIFKNPVSVIMPLITRSDPQGIPGQVGISSLRKRKPSHHVVKESAGKFLEGDHIFSSPVL